MSRLTGEEAIRLRAALEPLVRRAGDHLLGSFERLGEDDVRHKGRVDLVTRLDLEAEAILVEGLERLFPGEHVVAEESGRPEGPANGRVWFVDPLDGTTNFVHGQPVFAVSVGCARDGHLEAGMIYAPYLRELFWGASGCGAALGTRRLTVSRRTALDAALLATGFPYDVRTNPHNNLEEWSELAVRCRGLRRAGAASLDLAYVAAGRFDGYWEFRLQPWDLAAGALLVAEAGGRVTDPEGGPSFLDGGDLVATNGLLHPELLDVLRAVRERRGPPAPAGGDGELQAPDPV